jgi:hypothetical protein
MLASLQETIGEVYQSGECYFKKTNNFGENKIKTYKMNEPFSFKNQIINTNYILNNNLYDHNFGRSGNNLTLK